MTLTAAEVEAVIRAGVPMAEDIGFTVDETGDRGYARTRLVFSERLIRPGGTLSGPVQMALADASMYAAVMAAIGRVEMAVTSNLSINFLHKPAPADLVGEATVLRMGRRIAVCEVRLLSGEGDQQQVVAHVTGSYALPHDR
ncbi:PaaI family thioesterase [Marinobacter orientalis]|uniref:PaaI family thioesterase n=1 Tax=Marinobacter orientalis TaxID=1928859 RepID=A0A7Y0RCW4_9GAMM|nr:PaaI family thioesterase [Marinobacter orientalis]NMT63914.1 PaaI family thioesterase [Marinobacter orientalis]TGX50012.1 PaaI family thioesterase [Marinobacter orientalis]